MQPSMHAYGADRYFSPRGPAAFKDFGKGGSSYREQNAREWASNPHIHHGHAPVSAILARGCVVPPGRAGHVTSCVTVGTAPYGEERTTMAA